MLLSETRTSLSDGDLIFFKIKLKNIKTWQNLCLISAAALCLLLYFFDIAAPLFLPIFLALLFALNRFFYLAEQKNKCLQEIEYAQKLIIKGYAKEFVFTDDEGTEHYHYKIGEHIISKRHHGAVNGQLYEVHFSTILGITLWIEKIKA